MSEVPDLDACRRPEDVGRFEYDERRDIWYECCYDSHRDLYTWVIVPPANP